MYLAISFTPWELESKKKQAGAQNICAKYEINLTDHYRCHWQMFMAECI